MAVAKQKKVRKAVIAAAGFGTRFLPQTKAMPKEMLPLVDKPVVQYIVEELVEAGIEDIIIVTGYHKRSIEDHFDYISADLRLSLESSGKTEILDQTSKISQLANFVYVRQKGPYGNATPVLNVEHLIGGEPFIYAYADDLFIAKPSRFQQMIDLYNERGASVVPCVRASRDEDYSRYGFVAGKELHPGLIDMTTMVEKPGKAGAPSNLASVSGYLFTSDVFRYIRQSLERLESGAELYIPPAMQKMIDDGHKLLALEITNGTYYDTGNKLGYMKTTVELALQHPEIAEQFRAYLKDKMSSR
jgi:UTP--glucose-1-phosphate uridylyltransferase